MMKTRKEPPTLNAAGATLLTPRDLVKWVVPKGKILTDSVIDPHEDAVIAVTGYVRLVKLSDDDCDLHIQLSEEAFAHVPQIIAEIPPSETETRLELAKLLGVRIHRANEKPIPFDGSNAVKITVIGKAFDDASHWTETSPKTGNDHGRGVSTLWEVHPVWKVQRAE